MIAILGSGFGLYGYVPALAKSHPETSLILEAAYQSIFFQRQELKSYLPRIEWAETREEALATANIVAIALRPADQWIWGCRLSDYPRITHVLLEKPLAETPHQSDSLLSLLYAAGKTVRVGYNFYFTLWGEELLLMPPSPTVESLEISWRFKAHHFLHAVDTWKKSHEHGGGVLRFYGIHLIALLAAMGYEQVLSSEIFYEHDPDIPYRWIAKFRGMGLADCHVEVDSNTMEQAFSITQLRGGYDHVICRLAHPFEKPVLCQDLLDARVDVVTSLCMTIEDDNDALWLSRYWKTNSLWGKVEALSEKVQLALAN